jgi:hypothetical protein
MHFLHGTAATAGAAFNTALLMLFVIGEGICDSTIIDSHYIILLVKTRMYIYGSVLTTVTAVSL